MSPSVDIFLQSQLMIAKRENKDLKEDIAQLRQENEALRSTIGELPTALLKHARGAQLAAAEAEVATLTGVIKDLFTQNRTLAELVRSTPTDTTVHRATPVLGDAFVIDPSAYVTGLKTLEDKLVDAKRLLGENMAAIDFEGTVRRVLALDALNDRDSLPKAGLRYTLKTLLREHKVFRTTLEQWKSEIEGMRATGPEQGFNSPTTAYKLAIQGLVTATLGQTLNIAEVIRFSEDVESAFEDVLKTIAEDEKTRRDVNTDAKALTELMDEVEEIKLEFEILRLQYESDD